MYKTAFKKIIADFLLYAPFILFLFFRLDGIFLDMSNSDSARWFRRSESFAQSIKKLDFAETYRSYHPGVTLMWLTSGVETGIKIYDSLKKNEFKTLENTEGFILISGISKVVLVLILFVLLVVQFNYIEVLFDRRVAVLYAFLIALEPYMIGINRWFHLTSLEVFFTFSAFLGLLVWSDTKIKSYLYKSGIFFGLAVLTKFSSIILVPVFLLVFAATFLKDKVGPKGEYLKDFLKYVLITLVTIFILFPALWVKPLDVITKISVAAFNAKSGEYTSVAFAENNPYLFYLAILAFKLSPITLVVFALSLFKWTIWRERLFTYNVIYILFTLLMLSISEQKIERYILMVIPAILLLCAITLSRVGPTLQYPLILSSIAFMYLIFRTSHPIYSAYYSPAFGGPKAAFQKGLYDDNGEYFAAAARYLNQKGREIHVFVPNNVEAFSYYFKGHIDEQLLPTTNYYVASNDSRRKNITLGLNCPKIEKTFYNYNFEPVHIYSCFYIHLEDYDFDPAH